MKKFLIWIAIIAAVLFIAMFAVFHFMKRDTKKASPESIVEYKNKGKQISVFYCMPSKKGRVIFGGLVPYGKVWRTGANEATTFTTSTDLKIFDKTLPAGKYTLWTIPGPHEWTVIWNGKMYDWGINYEGIPSREPEADVLQVKVPVQNLDTVVERFTISFVDKDSLTFNLTWDDVKIAVPIE